MTIVIFKYLSVKGSTKVNERNTPFALVGHETGHSQFSSPSALME